VFFLSIGTATASILWSISVISEVVLMWSFATVVKRFSARWLYDIVAVKSYWAMAVLALCGGLCVLLSFYSELDDPVSV